MLSFFEFGRMALQQLGPQRLERRPEPSDVTSAEDNVVQYDRVMATKLALSYAAGMEMIHRARGEVNEQAIDLACGPGHYTLCLGRYLGYQSVTGMDLSGPMVEVAKNNAGAQQLQDRVTFEAGDITKLTEVETDRFDLASFTGAAHHMPNLDTVANIAVQMDRITKPSGLVMIMDLARLRTAELTERYVRLLASDYVDRGLPAFLDDFRNSMYAAWTPREFRTIIPGASRRWWCHLVPHGVPTIQFVLGLPVGRKKVFIRRGFSLIQNPLINEWYSRWKQIVGPEWAEATLQEWKLLRMTLSLASKRRFPPGRISNNQNG